MKRICCFALCVLLIGGICPALAQAGSIRIEELSLDVAVPQGYAAFTRATAANDPELLALGLDYGELYRAFMQNNAYLSAFAGDPFTQITVAMHAGESTKEVESYKTLDTDALHALGEQFLALGAPVDGNAYGYTAFGLHETEQASYLVFEISGSDASKMIAGRQYQTICNGQSVSFTMIAYAPALTRAQEDALLFMVEGSVFDAGARAINTGNLLLASVGMLAVGGLTVFMALRRNKRLQKAPRRPHPRDARDTGICPNCGARLPVNGNYCHACGEWAGNRA